MECICHQPSGDSGLYFGTCPTRTTCSVSGGSNCVYTKMLTQQGATIESFYCEDKDSFGGLGGCLNTNSDTFIMVCCNRADFCNDIRMLLPHEVQNIPATTPPVDNSLVTRSIIATVVVTILLAIVIAVIGIVIVLVLRHRQWRRVVEFDRHRVQCITHSPQKSEHQETVHCDA